MLRILIFILSAVVVAGVATVLLGIDGRVVAEAFGIKYDIHTGFALLSLLIGLSIVIAALLAFRALARAPRAMRDFSNEGRRAKGLEALMRGFEAVAVGDGAAAMRQARIAEQRLKNAALTRLLTAQAAQVAGDDAAARAGFNAMLASPETEFLGLRGLYAQAGRAGETEAARGYAERAFRLRPNAVWAFESMLSLGLERGAWGETRAALATAQKHKSIDPEKARRGQAALMAADAYAAAATGETKLALEEAEEALKLAPSLTPAALLAARLHGAGNRRARAVKTLERAFAAAPHMSIVDATLALFKAEATADRAEALRRLAATAPEANEARFALATRKLLLGEYPEVARILEPLLRMRATARMCALMAETAMAAGGHDSEAIARDWLKRAVSAPRDFSPGGDRDFELTRDGWAQLIREFMEHGRLAPPTLETAHGGVPDEDIKRLALVKIEPQSPSATEPRGSPPTEFDSAHDLKLAGDAVRAARAVSAAGEVS